MSIYVNPANSFAMTDTLATTAVVPWKLRGGSIQALGTDPGSTAIYACHSETGTFDELKDTNGTAVTIAFAGNDEVHELPSAVFAVPYLKFVVANDCNCSVVGGT